MLSEVYITDIDLARGSSCSIVDLGGQSLLDNQPVALGCIKLTLQFVLDPCPLLWFK